MKISYKKLWKLLIDKDMLKKDLAAKAEICNALQCDISDIMEMVEDDSEGGLDND